MDDQDGYENVVKNTISRHCNSIAIIPSHSAWKVFFNFARMKLVLTVWMFEENIKKPSLGTRVLLITSKLPNSRGCQDENGLEMYQIVKLTCSACRAIVFVHCFIVSLFRLLFHGVLVAGLVVLA